MNAKQLLKELPENKREEVVHFLTSKVHPDEIDGPNDILVIPTSKTSNFDKILLERERKPDPKDNNQTLQETAVIGLNTQELGPDIVTFIQAWSPDSFKAEMNAPNKIPRAVTAMEMA